MIRFIFLGVFLFGITGCVTSESIDGGVHCPWGAITPAQAIKRAAEEPGTFIATVAMRVRRIGEGKGSETGFRYLDSLDDYRDPRSLNVIIFPQAAQQLAASPSGTIFNTVLNQGVLVRGCIRRVKIFLYSDGVRTGDCYYQTQMEVADARQVVTIASESSPNDPPILNILTARPADYQKQYPELPALASYQERLQKRIDTCFSDELRTRNQYTDTAVAPNRHMHLTITVLANGMIAANTKEMEKQLSREPALTKTVLSVFARIAEKPEPFSEALKKEAGRSFTYDAYFSIQ